MGIEILDYIGIMATVSIALYAYMAYKDGKFSKDYKKDKEKKQVNSNSWWKNSRIYEVYVINAKQRANINALPWFGVVVSGFAFLTFTIWFYLDFSNPIQPFEKLTKYSGTVIGYSLHRKTDDILKIKLDDGNIKKFHKRIFGKKAAEKIMNKKVNIWSQKNSDLLGTGYYEHVGLIHIEGKNIFYDSNGVENNSIDYITHYNKVRNLETTNISHLILSLKWLLGFLALLWLINRKPVTNINKMKKD